MRRLATIGACEYWLQSACRALLLLAFCTLAPPALATTPCLGNPDALGTERVLVVDTSTPRVGRKHFPQTLSLSDKEVVLTFDDGPWPGTTPRVLDILKRECVRATFFLIGRNAAAHPALLRREATEGHTIAHHSFAHPWLGRMRAEAALADIDRGIAAVNAALGDGGPPAPFFRFPGFLSSPALLDRVRERGLIVFSTDLWASDWNRMGPAQELRLVLARLNAMRGGIVLFHDTKEQTTRMLPSFLRELKRGGYRVVHIVPNAPAPESAASSAGMEIVRSDQQTPPVRAAEDKPGGEAPDER